MRFVIVLLSLFYITETKAGGFSFPNVEYEYAYIYLLNTSSQDSVTQHTFDFSVYKDGRYAASKVGDGWELTATILSEMNAIFRLGVDEMVAGLSGCFIPRHGVIYFNKTGTPVASISICFECERIAFWSSNPLPEFKPITNSKNEKRTIKQFNDLSNLFQRNAIPVFKTEPEYANFITANNSLFGNMGEMFINQTTVKAFDNITFSVEEVELWLLKSFGERFSKSINERPNITSSNSEKKYIMLTLKDGSTFEFNNSDNSAKLLTASISNPSVILPNGISVGMSISQVQNSFSVWDGLEAPYSIVVSYQNAIVRYLFEKRTLIRIELVVI